MNICLNSSTDITGAYSILQGGDSIVECGTVHNSRPRHLTDLGHILRLYKFLFSYLQSGDDKTYITRKLEELNLITRIKYLHRDWHINSDCYYCFYYFQWHYPQFQIF